MSKWFTEIWKENIQIYFFNKYKWGRRKQRGEKGKKGREKRREEWWRRKKRRLREGDTRGRKNEKGRKKEKRRKEENKNCHCLIAGSTTVHVIYRKIMYIS